MSILVVGSVALDTIKTPFGREKDVLGGSATYFSISAGLFGCVRLVAVVGNDFPKRYVSFLKKKGIDVRGLAVKTGKTFRWEGEYGWDFADPRTISTRLNVFSDFDPVIPEEYKKSEYVFLANIDPELQMKVLGQMTRPKFVACDTMNYWIENKRKHLTRLLGKIDLFFLNESEAKELTGCSSIIRAARGILKMGPKRIIIKKGEHGSLLFSENSVFSTPAFLLESICDPTGAGDTFAGGVMGYLSTQKTVNDKSIKRAIAYGGVMATFAVEDFSLMRLASVKKTDIKKRFENFRRLTSF
ncbi:MAG: sugar kinase [Candidatus Omnitrophica bacterium]|nr:sugar kinase [Candidatus Omnitrophota bacterium]